MMLKPYSHHSAMRCHHSLILKLCHERSIANESALRVPLSHQEEEDLLLSFGKYTL